MNRNLKAALQRFGKTSLLLILAWCRLEAKGQQEFIGVATGVNISNVHSNIHVGKPFNIGASVGFVYKYVPMPWLELSPGLLFDQRGFVYIPTSNVVAHMNYYYMTMPLQVVFRNKADWFYGFIGLGVDPSLKIAAFADWPVESTHVPVRDPGSLLVDCGAFMEPGIGFDIKDQWNIKSSLKVWHSFTNVPNQSYNSYFNILNYGFYVLIQANYKIKWLVKK